MPAKSSYTLPTTKENDINAQIHQLATDYYHRFGFDWPTAVAIAKAFIEARAALSPEERALAERIDAI